MKKLIICLTGLLVLCIAGSGWAKVLYVKTDGSDNNNGLAWQYAVQNIQLAVGLADPDDQIWVAGGTYALSTRIVVDKAVGIYGGFAGGETDLSQRDWENNVTTVDGQDSVNCFTVTADVTIDGFFIKRGVGVDGIGYQDAGGGIHHSSSSLIVANCNLTENHIANDGGAIYSESNTSLLVTDCTFTDNISYGNGGAIRGESGDLIVLDCTFTNNKVKAASYSAGFGAAIYASSGCNITITDCTFDSNSAEHYAGAIYASQGIISNSVFSDNFAKFGAGAIIAGGSLLINNCKFTSNSSSSGLSGAINISGQPKITNCLFIRNVYSNSRYDQESGGGAINI